MPRLVNATTVPAPYEFWTDFADGLWRIFGHFRALFGRPRARHRVRLVALYWMEQFLALDVNSEAPNATCSYAKYV